jgi:hypothetical protein
MGYTCGRLPLTEDAMNLTRTVFITFVVAALFSNPCSAQQPVRTVTVSDGKSDNKFQRGVVDALKARIAATSRYVLAEPSEVGELEVGVVCMDMSEDNLNGGVCSYAFTYWPKELLSGLTVQLGPLHLSTDSNAISMGEKVFQKLVEASSEAKLAATLSQMEASAELYVVLKKATKPY